MKTDSHVSFALAMLLVATVLAGCQRGVSEEQCQKVNVTPPIDTPAHLSCGELDSTKSWARQLSIYRPKPEAMQEFGQDVVNSAGSDVELKKFWRGRCPGSSKLETLREAVEPHVKDDQRVLYEYRAALKPSTQVPSSDDELLKREADRSKSFWCAVLVEKKPALSLDAAQDAKPVINRYGSIALRVTLDSNARDEFADLTRERVDKQLVFAHGEFVVSNARVMEPIEGGRVDVTGPLGPAGH